MEIFARELSNRHPLNIEECGANDVANEDVKLRACESTFGDFLCKTLSAGKRALDAVKDFDERNQMTVKTALPTSSETSKRWTTSFSSPRM